MEGLLGKFDESCRAWAGPILLYVVRDPDDLETVLKSVPEKHEMYSKFGFPHGLFTLNGEAHKTHRKLLLPSFSLKSLQSYIPAVNRESRIFVAKIKREFLGKEFEIFHVACEFTLRNVLATLFGLSEIPEDLVEQYHADTMK